MVALYVGFHLLGWISFGATLTNFGLSGGLFMLLLAPDFFQPLREFAAGYHDRAAVAGLAERTDDIFNVQRTSIVGHLDATAHRHLDRPLASSVDVRRLTVRLAGCERPLLKRANLAVAAIPLVIAAGIPATQAIPIHLGSLTLTFNNLGLGALSAIVLYQLLRPGHVRDKEAEPAEVVSR